MIYYLKVTGLDLIFLNKGIFKFCSKRILKKILSFLFIIVISHFYLKKFFF